MMQHAHLFIVLLPVSAALLCLLFSRIQKNLGSWIVIGSIAAAFMSAVTVLQQVIADGGKPIHYWMGNWQPPLGIEFVIDPISGVLAVLITFISISSFCSSSGRTDSGEENEFSETGVFSSECKTGFLGIADIGIKNIAAREKTIIDVRNFDICFTSFFKNLYKLMQKEAL